MITDEKITEYNDKHLLDSDVKLKHWGYGEWIEEPDIAEFKYNGWDCKIIRGGAWDRWNNDHLYGGHLCGYVSVPSNHPFYQKKYEDIDIECHGGLTFGECNDRHWIGFDCGHSHDYIPSIEYLKKTDPMMIEIWERHNELMKKYPDSMIWHQSYKNIDFCILECISMVNQLKEMESHESADKT
jgi:hypothetical protein